MNISKEMHLKVAFFWWGAVGTMLLIVGSGLLFGGRSLSVLNTGPTSPGTAQWVGLAIALCIGFIKGRFVFRKVARRYIKRIQALPEKSPVYMTFSLKSWGLILCMMALGMILRALETPHLVRGVIDIAVGLALVLGSKNYLIHPS
ncbi:MAG: hypothetical protein ABGX83_09595 [Nitrospira sp.]|nr:hypothetical protein [Candidatus Manganitrophaceae bacterium]HIL35000.1 hypothetical protein [Candidatus Manganitrophaceae bacterium]